MAEGHVIIRSKDGGSILRPNIWRQARTLDDIIANQMTIQENLTYQDLCAKVNDHLCLRNSFLDLNTELLQLSYPETRDPITHQVYRVAGFLGGMTMKEDDVVASATAIRLSYILDASSNNGRNARLWESAFLNLLKNHVTSDDLIIDKLTPQSVETELAYNLNSAIEWFPLSMAFVVAYILSNSLDHKDIARSKPYVAILGIVNIALAALSAWGLLMYAGVAWQSINLAGLFILLGVGLDDVFIMMSSWRLTSIEWTVPERMAATFDQAAISITITSLTNVVSFMVGAIIPVFPAVRIFCLYAGVGILFVYLWTLTFFGGVLAISGAAEEAQRHNITCRKMDKPPSSSLPIKEEEDFLVKFFDQTFATFLSTKIAKALVLLLFGVYIVISICAIFYLEEGLERSKLARSDSFLASFYDTEDRYFRRNPYRIQVVFPEPMDYSNDGTRSEISDLIGRIRNSRFIDGDDKFVENWIDVFDKVLKRKEEMERSVNISGELSFVRQLDSVLTLTPISVIQRNIRLNQNR